ncbi:hypothetical protein N0A02_03290 [Paraburkholderia acidicola]|uniref:Uncharacterized protein n=1 Tax=Paraburkholderia acidicola TaxID=1912599 RepID=A0ABV1LGQ5_9BURK
MTNALNFSGGPGALPEAVLRQTREAIVASLYNAVTEAAVDTLTGFSLQHV